MITLIAESKTMNSRQSEIARAEYLSHVPPFEDDAGKIMNRLSILSPAELASTLSISQKLAAKAAEFIYEFPNKSMGYLALEGFTGEVFRGLDAASLSGESRRFADSHLMIVSSLYGLLMPCDIIKPYRLDFSTRCSPDDKALSSYWKQKLTIAFVKHLKETGEKEVADLLPGEAAKCLDWKIIRAFAKVVKCDFRIITDAGDVKTPDSGRLKLLRGKMVRTILENRIDSIAALTALDTDTFMADPENSRPGLPLFISKL